MLQRTESLSEDETLTKNCDLINKLTDVVITYDFDDCTETVDRDMIKNWLTTDENGLYTLDKKQIEAYISELSAKYDTVGTERTFNTYDGREITVSGGNYGWQINQKAELKELTELIKTEKPRSENLFIPMKVWSGKQMISDIRI